MNNKTPTSKIRLIHGFCRVGKKERIYVIWEALLRRCTNKKQDNYKWYGGRGIKCEWSSFEEFKNDMYKSYLKHVEKFGEKNTSLDRKDSNKNYCKKNCKWSTLKEQSRNTRSNRIITFKGKTFCCAKWAEILGFENDTLLNRFYLGWTVEKALTTPLRIRKK